MYIMLLQKERASSSSEALSLRIHYIPSSVHYTSLKLSFLCMNNLTKCMHPLLTQVQKWGQGGLGPVQRGRVRGKGERNLGKTA